MVVHKQFKDYTHLTHILEDIIQLWLHGHELDIVTFEKPSTMHLYNKHFDKILIL